MKKICLLSVSLILSVLLSSAQSGVNDLERYMKSLRDKPYDPVPSSVLNDRKNVNRMAIALRNYHADTLEQIRSRSYYILTHLGVNSNDIEIRRKTVQTLCAAVKDKSSGIAGNAIQSLTQFRPEDFNTADRDSIGQYLNVGVAHIDKLIRLAGYLQLEDHRNTINDILRTSKLVSLKWSARVALARMGDQASIAYIRNKLGTAVINDDFVYDVAPDLVYTRQKEIFRFLEKVIQSDEKACDSPDPDSNLKMECGYRVMEAITIAIEGFPYQIDESGSLETDNYKTALENIRQWFIQNPDYKISQNTF
jgi:hypothetical protein